MAVELFREMVRRTVVDPEVADSLSPKGYPIGCKRPVLDNGYFETFNRENVIARRPAEGPRGGGRPRGRAHDAKGLSELDVLIFATGFDAVSGALTRIDVHGVDGRLLRDDWADGPRAFMGFGVTGYPNMFMIIGPGSVGVLATYPPHIELQVGWIADFLDHLTEQGKLYVEVEPRPPRTSGATRSRRPSIGSMFRRPHVQLLVQRRQHRGQGPGLPHLPRAGSTASWREPGDRRERLRGLHHQGPR